MAHHRYLKWFGVVLFSVVLLFAYSSSAYASTTITTCTDLQKIGNDPSFLSSGSYVLGSNIDCSASATWNPISGGGYYGFFPLANFTGTFNGNGHAISGLYINSATSSDVGLFSEVSGSGLVENIGLSGGTIIGTGSIGGLIGDMENTATLQNASTTATVTGTGDFVGGLVGSGGQGTLINDATSSAAVIFSGRGYGAGGIVGYFHGTVENSDSNGTITTGDGGDVGGIIGYNEITGVVASSTSSETITGTSDLYTVGGIAGVNYNSIISSYFTGSINAAGLGGIIGGIVGEDDSTFGIQDSYYNIDTVSIMGDNIPTTHGIYTSQYNAWVSGGYEPLNFATYFPSTDGSGYYDLSSAAQLKNLLAFTDNDLTNDKFLITAPIALPTGFMIPNMNALEFNGGNQTLSGLTVSAPAWGSLGFFGTIAVDSTIKDIVLTGVNLAAQEAGGLAEINNGIIENSSVAGSLSGNFGMGGLVSDNEGTIATSTASTTITGIVQGDDTDPGTFGGLVGVNNGSIWGSSAMGSLTVDQDNAEYLAGLVGGNDGGSISGSSADVAITATGAEPDNVGGLVGYSDAPISDSYATGNVVTGAGNSAQFVGGLVGDTDSAGSITDSYATGNVEGNFNVGGFVGGASDNITDSYSLGEVTGTGSAPTSIGGFVGANETTIADSYSTGSVNIDESDGSLGYQVGGFAGYNDDNVEDSYSLGNVTTVRTTDDVGGFIGLSDHNEYNVYSVGAVYDTASDGSVGGFMGLYGGFISNGAWYTGESANAVGLDTSISGPDATLSANSYGTDVSTPPDFYETTQTVYTGGTFPWDFSDTWTSHPGTYPTLQAFPDFEPVTLTTVIPIASQVTGTSATYTFAINNSGSRPGSIVVSSCGVSVQISMGTNTVTLSGLTGGQTYSCSFDYHMTDDGSNSNSLFVGPFTVQASQSSPPVQSTQGVSGQGSGILPSTASSTASSILESQWTSLMTEYQSLLTQLAALHGSTTPSVTTAPTTIPVQNLQQGAKGPEVTALQNVLIRLGKGTAAAALKAAGVSGYFGSLTKTALIEYQKSVGIKPASGYFGSLTRAEMKSSGVTGLWW